MFEIHNPSAAFNKMKREYIFIWKQKKSAEKVLKKLRQMFERNFHICYRHMSIGREI